MSSKIEQMIAAWQRATPKQQETAFNALTGQAPLANQQVIKFGDIAKRLGVTKRTVFTAIKNAGIKTVVLPNRTRSIGILVADLPKLEGGQS